MRSAAASAAFYMGMVAVILVASLIAYTLGRGGVAVA